MEDEKEEGEGEEVERCEWGWQLQGRVILDHPATATERERDILQ